jgi:8-oxo-dGTP pyrophosphatase MutT (NUDIX family)
MEDFSKKYNFNKKKIKPKLYCSNCGKYGHKYHNCNEPITSYGVILISVASDDPEIVEHLIESLSHPDTNDRLLIHTHEIEYKSLNDLETFCKYKDNIKFLMIRRKHTLGYIEFLRGRYYIENIEGIIFLFEQMTPEEIIRIGTLEFDDLWNELWSHPQHKVEGSDEAKNFHYKEYVESKQKFDKLKSDNEEHLNLDFYVDNVKPSYNYAEWGFPKGRRSYQESDLDCAVREFREESGFDHQEYLLLDKLNPIEEKFYGTNGVFYKHVYYIGLCITDKMPELDPTNTNQVDEVGDISWVTYEEAINLIRPHHTERKKILIRVYMFLLNHILEMKREKKLV